jgi:Acyl-coenzyme A oxidase N-terminal
MSYMSHKEKYEEAMRRTTIVLRKIKKLQSEGRGGDELYEYETHANIETES